MEGSFGQGTSLRFALLKTLTSVDQEDELHWVGRIVCQHVCRLTNRRQYRKSVKHLFADPNIIKKILDIKDELDHTIYKNRLFKSVHTMCCFLKKTQKRYIETAYANRVQVEDVRWCIDLLTSEERNQLVSKWDDIPIHNKEGVEALLKPLQGHVKSLARRHLSYVSRYDQGQDQEDIIADLNMFATYLVRRYEVNNLSREHLLRTINQGLTHHVANLSSAYGRPKRRPIERIHKRAILKLVWWLNPKNLTVKKVIVDAVSAPRKITKTGDLQGLDVLKKSSHQAPSLISIQRGYVPNVLLSLICLLSISSHGNPIPKLCRVIIISMRGNRIGQNVRGSPWHGIV